VIHTLAEDYAVWWREQPLVRGTVTAVWRGGVRLPLGEFRDKPHGGWFRFAPAAPEGLSKVKDPDELTDRSERVAQLFGKAATRAGFLRPQIDPDAWTRLLGLEPSARFEFILDTNTLCEGAGHFLVGRFADRCDLVVTAVTLRELQDQYSRAKFYSKLNDDKKDGDKKEGDKTSKKRSEMLGARHLFLAGNRFREWPGHRRVLWRELEADDTSLLLSRGIGQGGKTSESDTLVLRSVRRAIQDRVHGLERFFVCGDTALARRAASELPAGSVIAARARDLEPGRVYTPLGWWPGPDQGLASGGRGLAALWWEFLAIADEIEVVGEPGGPGWRLTAFNGEPWPSDYARPWISVERIGELPAVRPATAWPRQAVLSPDWPLLSVAPRATSDDNLRPPAWAALEALGAFGSGHAWTPSQPVSMQATQYLKRFFAVLGFHVEAGSASEGLPELWIASDVDRLRRVFEESDLEGLLAILAAWAPFQDVAMAGTADRPGVTVDACQRICARLGVGDGRNGGWRPGARPVDRVALQRTLDMAVEEAATGALAMEDLLERWWREDGVSPTRITLAWPRLFDSGLFDGLDLRRGGTSARTWTVSVPSPQGWEARSIDLQAIDGYRDIFRNRG
jgi:hypothetical protein